MPRFERLGGEPANIGTGNGGGEAGDGGVTVVDESDDLTESYDEAQLSNGAAEIIDETIPYIAIVRVEGVCPILFHRYNAESVEEKSNAAKGSRAKKTDDVESYVYRTADGMLGIPGNVLRGALETAGRFMQDPRSPRKSCRDLVKAAIIGLDDCAALLPQTKRWDYIDRRRVVVQRSAVTRARPAMNAGWQCQFRLLINLPQYITEHILQKLLRDAGLYAGLCDYHPTYGRFNVVHYERERLGDG